MKDGVQINLDRVGSTYVVQGEAFNDRAAAEKAMSGEVAAMAPAGTRQDKLEQDGPAATAAVPPVAPAGRRAERG